MSSLPDWGKSAGAESALSYHLNHNLSHELLTREEEVDLARQIALGRIASQTLAEFEDIQQVRAETESLQQTIATANAARERLVGANMRLVTSIAMRARRSGSDLEDLIQDGHIGLLKAVEKFDGDKGFKFSTYATWWIKQSIERRSHRAESNIVVPENIQERLNTLSRMEYDMTDRNGNPPSDKELAEVMSTTPSEIADLRQIRDRKNTLKLDAPIGREKDSFTQYDVVKDDSSEVGFEEAETRHEIDQIKRMIDDPHILSDRERTVMKHRLQGDTLAVISNIHGIACETIRRIEERAIIKLRARVAAHPEYTNSPDNTSRQS